MEEVILWLGFPFKLSFHGDCKRLLIPGHGSRYDWQRRTWRKWHELTGNYENSWPENFLWYCSKNRRRNVYRLAKRHKCKRKRYFARMRRRWVGNTKMDSGGNTSFSFGNCSFSSSCSVYDKLLDDYADSSSKHSHFLQCASAANADWRAADIFGTKTVSLHHIL
jgi:hypothetical protein